MSYIRALDQGLIEPPENELGDEIEIDEPEETPQEEEQEEPEEEVEETTETEEDAE